MAWLFKMTIFSKSILETADDWKINITLFEERTTSADNAPSTVRHFVINTTLFTYKAFSTPLYNQKHDFMQPLERRWAKDKDPSKKSKQQRMYNRQGTH